MSLIRLIYASHATPQVDFAALKDILFVAQAHNSGCGITGALAFGQGCFLQILEGERGDVSRLYNKILGDRRHHDVELIEAVAVTERDFSQWSMRYIPLFEGDYASRYEAILERLTGSTLFTPHRWDAPLCLSLLKAASAES